MIKSMTGCGNGSGHCGALEFTVEVRCVNHRYSDFNIKYPRAFSFAEDSVRKKAAQVIKRGKADIFINIENKEAAGGCVAVDMELAKGYYEGMKLISSELGLSMERISPVDFLRAPDVFLVSKAEADEEELLKALMETLGEALENFDKMRVAEGEKLMKDMNFHLGIIENAVFDIEKRVPAIVDEYRARVEARMKEFLENVPVDEGRLLNEVAIFSDRVNVNEEIVRLKSHISQMRGMFKSGEPVGRKMDFLIQEMNREINTIGSKSNDLETARLVIDVKAEIEKLREQCQNVE